MYSSSILIITSPVSPAHMDWSTYYPAFVADAEEGQTGSKSEMDTGVSRVRTLRRDVEVADIGCGFGGLLVALAPVLPDTLLLGMLDLQKCCQNSHNYQQEWKSECKSQNMFKNGSKLYEPKIQTPVSTKMQHVYEPTP